jgi:hypothetical protein
MRASADQKISHVPPLLLLPETSRVRFLFDLVTYCDVQVQSNTFYIERDKHVLIERAMVRLLLKLSGYRIRKRQGYIEVGNRK